MRRQGSGRDDAAMSQERQAPPEAGRAAEGPPPPPRAGGSAALPGLAPRFPALGSRTVGRCVCYIS